MKRPRLVTLPLSALEVLTTLAYSVTETPPATITDRELRAIDRALDVALAAILAAEKRAA